MNHSHHASPIPTLTQVDRIAELEDPVLRNLQITQCYSELSTALTVRTGLSANWCTFATWASKQAGQSIRKEDLLRTLERVFQESAEARQAEAKVAASIAAESTAGTVAGSAPEARSSFAPESLEKIGAALRRAVNLRSAVARASDAVGRGNLKVFAEIGREFARFYAELLTDAEPDLEKLDRFCASLRPGEPPDGQRFLSQAFRRYYRAFFSEDPKTRSELLLTANIEIGFHEQTRLQPEIAEALDAAFFNAASFTRYLIAAVFPTFGWLATSNWILRGLLRRPTAFDRALQAWLSVAQLQTRQALTETMMTIHLPPDVLVRLGDDLTAGFPEILRQLADSDLCGLLAQLDPTPDSLVESGALDWANLPDRLHFIIDLFRCYQESPDLFAPPFTSEQVAAIKAGQLPRGRL